MLNVFLDTSVIYPAVHSSTGASRELFRLAFEDRVNLIVSENILVEAERNIRESIPTYLPVYHALLHALNPHILPFPPLKLVRQVETYVFPKDAPIVAAAIQAHPDYFASLDKRHILKPEVAQKSGLRIIRPDVVLFAVRAEQKERAQAA